MQFQFLFIPIFFFFQFTYDTIWQLHLIKTSANHEKREKWHLMLWDLLRGNLMINEFTNENDREEITWKIKLVILDLT